MQFKNKRNSLWSEHQPFWALGETEYEEKYFCHIILDLMHMGWSNLVLFRQLEFWPFKTWNASVSNLSSYLAGLCTKSVKHTYCHVL